MTAQTKTKKKEIEDVIEQIVNEQLTKSLSESFNRYAKAVISDRAIPDVRDGLKPVQRRILYGMYKKHFTFDRETVKSATIVGDIMGNYHPHGDASIYDALVRLSQDWKANVPLVAFQGNNGSLDNDPPAAYRYTEAKLSEMADYMLKDIDCNTVDMCYTFDDKHLEPTVLPGRFPNLLVNGASGIAIGSATNIPTHNINEVINAIIYRIEHKRATVDDLLEFVKGPDFPTGGIIDDVEALHQIYTTGQGSFAIYSKTEIDEKKNQIIITEIPYGAVKSTFVHDLDDRVIKDKVDNIDEIRDESTENIRIVIDVKKGTSPQDVLNYLNSKGLLKQTFATNMLAINKGHPKTMNLIEIVDAYIEAQQEIITRRSEFLKAKDEQRLNIVLGLIRAISVLDEVISIIRHSSGKADSKLRLMERFKFNEPQAEAIVTLQLYRLSNTDVQTLEIERSQIMEDIQYLEGLLTNIDKLNRVIINDLKEINKKLVMPRKTEIRQEKFKIEQVDTTKLIAKEDCYVVLTRDGYIKRTSNSSYQKSISEDAVDSLPKIKQGDRIALLAKTDTHQNIIAFTSTGNYIYLPVYALPEVKWKEEGKHLNNVITIEAKEKIVKAYLISQFKAGLYVVTVTRENKIKRTPLIAYELSKMTNRPIKCCNLMPDDKVVNVYITSGNDDVIIVNEKGFCSRYNENQAGEVGLKAGGVKAITPGKDKAPIVDFVAFDPHKSENSALLLVTDIKSARIFEPTAVPRKERLQGLTHLIMFSKSNHLKVVGFRFIENFRKNKDIVLATTETNEVVNLSNLTYSPLDTFMKQNILKEVGDKIKVIGLHDFSTTIDENTQVLIPKDKPKIIIEDKPEKENKTEQLNLFDDIDRLLGK